MIYAYNCPKCAHSFDVVKSHTESSTPETCQKCNTLAIKEFAPRRVYFTGEKTIDAEYNPGLGCVVKSAQHRKEVAKALGVEEIGNECPDKVHKHFDQAREQKNLQAYEEADRGWVGDGTS